MKYASINQKGNLDRISFCYDGFWWYYHINFRQPGYWQHIHRDTNSHCYPCKYHISAYFNAWFSRLQLSLLPAVWFSGHDFNSLQVERYIYQFCKNECQINTPVQFIDTSYKLWAKECPNKVFRFLKFSF